MTAHSDRARRFAIRLLRWYPKPWRVRYAREMRALIDQMPVGWGQVLNLAGAALREWFSLRALGWPSRSAAGRVWGARALFFLVAAYSLDAVARIIASRLRASGYEPGDSAITAAAILMFTFSMRIFVAMWAQFKNRRRPSVRSKLQLADWELGLWSLALLPFVIVQHAEPQPKYYLSSTMLMLRPWIPLLQVYVWINLAFQTSRRTQRLQRIQGVYLKRKRERDIHLSLPSTPLGLQ